MAKPRRNPKPDIQPASEYGLKLGAKLKKLREDVRKLSPEDLEAKVSEIGGQASASYIRRVEKGQNVPTVEMLSYLLRALGSNLGLFFEDEIEESTDVDAQDRKYQRHPSEKP